MKSQLRWVSDHGVRYQCLAFVCPGCTEPYQFLDGTMHTPSGLHMLAVNAAGVKDPQWSFNGNEEAPTLTPSILSHIQPYDEQGKPLGVCHSYLLDGVFQFLDDCTHSLKGQFVPMPDLHAWFTEPSDC